MPRKSLTGDKESKYAKFRVDTEVQGILENLKRQGVNISEFIRGKIKQTSFTRKPLNFENINLLKETAGIYAIINHKKGKFYIGQSNHVRLRLSQHFSGLKNKKHTNDHLQKDFINDGVKNFEFLILERIESSIENLEKILFEREQEWLNLINFEENYNSRIIGEANRPTAEQREEIIALQGQESSYQVAKRFNVSHTTVLRIWKKHTSNHKETIDTSILKKMIPVFVETDLKVKLEDNEVARVKELFEEVST